MGETLKQWIERKVSLGSVLNAILIIAFAIAFAVTARNDVDSVQQTQQEHLNDYQEYRQMVVPNTYVRQDVSQERYQAIRAQLDRIEQMLQQ